MRACSSAGIYAVTQRLRPTHTGRLTLPPVTAVVEGRPTRPALAITVTAGSGPTAPPGPGASLLPPSPGPPRGLAYHGWEKDLVLTVELDRKEAFLGEQVTAEFWLLSPLELRGYENATAPRFDGFWKEELETARRLEFEIRNVNGIPTRAYLVQRLALFPTREGELSVDPMELHGVAVALGPRSLLSPQDDVVRVDRKSASVSVRVKPLPPGAPAGFEVGNVGELSLDTTASPNRVAVGEPITIHIAVTGDGNVHALSLPHLAPSRERGPSSRPPAMQWGSGATASPGRGRWRRSSCRSARASS